MRRETNSNSNLKNSKPIVSDEKLIEIHEMGLTLKKSAEKLHVSAQTVRIKWRELGLKPNFKSGRHSKISDKKLKEVHEKGLTLKKSAERLKVSLNTVVRNWERLGLEANFSRGRPVSAAIVKETLKVYGKRLSESAMAEKLSITKQAVSVRLRRLGLKPHFYKKDNE